MKTNRRLIVNAGFIGLAGMVLLFGAPGSMVTRNALAQDKGNSKASPSAPAESAKDKPKQAKEQPKEQAQEQDAEDAGDVPTVEIPLDKQQLIGVKTAAVSVRTLGRVIRTVGRIEADEKKVSTINTKFEAWIEKLYVDYVGKYVKKGEPLAEVYSPELFATQQEFINLLKWTKQSNDVKDETVAKMLARDSESIVEAAKQRLRLLDISDEQIKMIAESGKPIRTLTISSPVNGYVVQKTALQGMRVMPGEKLFDIADLSTVWVIADIYENELPLVHTGDRAAISLSYFPGKKFSANIDYVYPVLAGDTRTAKVRFSIPNPGGQLKPQMFTNVEINVGMGRKLAIPEDAVIDTGTRQIVYVDKGDGYFEPREVVVGLKSDGFVEILKGLKAKERVATAATFLIDSEARLKGIVK
jgi:Cu(I)/Ag(I) efflux system membrane fusion protein